ncbi:MAG: hypothetical protein IIY19_04440 [Lachnospiraceae bacterium]|nr:hypothetical protein [Lachnospiraceae bacterium]
MGTLLCFLLLITGAGSLQTRADEGIETDIRYVTGQFITFYKHVSWEYPYSDTFFTLPSDQYDHNFARLSLGLALSAFRDIDHPEAQDDYLIEFFEDMGFGEIESETYRKEPETDSIAYGLATKKINDTTILACGVCGGNYAAEWASNLTVGDKDRSEGFYDASKKVQAAIRDYMDRHPADGPIKLWIAGFSRAAATSNITAADLTDAGIFDDVYAYTFATPCTTREPSPYPNIFNIMQKDDPVPKVPLEDWSYGHYGNDLYMVAMETDSDCGPVMEQADILYQKMLGAKMLTNSEITNHLRTIMDYLLMLLPEPSVYKQYLQPAVLDVLSKSDETMDALTVLLKALTYYGRHDKEHGMELKALQRYLSSLLGEFLKGSLADMPPEMWDPQFGIANLFHAHYPFEYLAMMFASDDPAALFSENTDYIRLVIYGIVDAEIMDGDNVLKTVTSDGKELVDGKEEPFSFPDVNCLRDKMVITLPADHSIQVKITSRSALPQTITYTGLLYTGHTVKAQADDFYSYLMSDGETATIVTSTDGRAIEPEESDYIEVSSILEPFYSPTTAMRLENNEVVRMTVSGLVNKLMIIIVFLILQMIASIILAIIRVKKKRKRNMTVAFIWHFVIAFIFAILEVAMWYFIPHITLARFIPAVVVCIVLIVYALKGYRYHKKGLKTFFILTGALVVYEILTSLLIGDFTFNKGLVELIAYIVFTVLIYLLMWRRKKPKEPKSEQLQAST